jgi:poly(A) polymerase
MTESVKHFVTVADPSQREILTAAAAVGESQNASVYIVGGFIRDSLLGRQVRDLDLAVEGDAGTFAEALATKLGAPLFTLHLEAGMYRIPLKEHPFDQIDVGAAAGTLAEDLARRDFTVDAMAVGLDSSATPSKQLRIIDPTGGLDDLENKVIRAIAPEVFQTDPARLLRGVRLAAELSFTIEPGTERLIAENAHLAASVAGERTREELLRLFSLPSAGAAIEYLDKLGLLTHIFPELEPSRGVDQPIEHNWDVLGHQLKTVSSIDWVLRRGEWPFASPEAQKMIPWDVSTEKYFNAPVNGGASRLALARLAALIHDIAKPETKTLAPSGRVRFYGHPGRGAETAAEMLKRLRFSHKEIKFVAAMVEAHMRPNQMGPEAIKPTPKAVYRFLRDTGDAAVATMYLSLADHLAARGPTLVLDNFREHVTIVAYVLAERGRQLEKAPKRLIDGYELESRFGVKPGKEMGRILEAVAEAQATGEIATKDEAFELADRLLREPPTIEDDRPGEKPIVQRNPRQLGFPPSRD